MIVCGKVCALTLTITGLVVCGGCSRTPEEQYARYMQRAKTHSERGDHSRAILDLLNATRAQPLEADGYYQLGLEYLSTNDRRQAIGALRRATEVNPKHTAAQLKIAELQVFATSERLIKDAQARVQKVLAASPTNDDALFLLAASDAKLGKAQDAEKFLQEIIDRSPRYAKAGLALAQMKIAAKDFESAEKILKRLSSQSPDCSDALIALGVLYTGTSKLGDAETVLRKAIALAPDNAAALSALGSLEIRTGKLVDAERMYKQLAALPEAEHRLAYVSFLLQENRRDTAVSELERLLKKYPDDRTVRTGLVAAYLMANRSADAVRVLAQALKKNPKDIDALTQRGEIYLKSRQPDEAQHSLLEVLRSDPGSWQAHYLMAQVHKAHGAWLQEKQELSEALRRKPDSLRVRIALTNELLASNDAKAALATLNEAPDSLKHTVPYLVMRNWALITVGDFSAARKTVDAVLSAGKFPEVLLQDGLLKLGAKNFAGARISLEEVVRNNPEDLRAVTALIETYVAQKQPAAAADALRKIVAERPKFVPLQMVWANWLLENGRNEEARKTLEEARAIEPQNEAVELGLARLSYREGDLETTRKLLERLISRHADTFNIEAHMLLGMTHEMRSDYAAAIAHYKRVIEKNDRHVGALNNLAYTLARNPATLDDALKYAQRAKEIAPDNASIRDTLGWVYYRKGLFRSAVTELEGALAGQITPTIQYHLGLAYKSAGNKKGNQYISEALAVDPKLATN